MKSIINKQLCDEIRAMVANKIREQKRLCFEDLFQNLNDVNTFITECIQNWNINFYLFIIPMGSDYIGYIVTQESIGEITEQQIKKESTWLVIDLKLMDGFTIDICSKNNGYELLVAAWGNKENVLNNYVNNCSRLEKLFRGN